MHCFSRRDALFLSSEFLEVMLASYRLTPTARRHTRYRHRLDRYPAIRSLLTLQRAKDESDPWQQPLLPIYKPARKSCLHFEPFI